MEEDAYHIAAFVGIILVCDVCRACIDGDELPGLPPYPDPERDAAIGDEAKRRGWKIAHRGGENPFLFSVLCDECAKNT